MWPGPAACPSLEDVRAPPAWWERPGVVLGFWHLCHWPPPGIPSPPFLCFWLLLACFVLCPRPSRLWVESQRPCWWEVAGSPVPLYVCHGLVSMCVHTCAWLCSGLTGQGQLVVLEDFSLGTEKGWQRLGQHREVTGLLTKPYHRDRCFSFFMPS